MNALFALLVLGAIQADATGLSLSMQGNPVRKVVGMLQKMTSSIEAESKVKEDMFNKFMCYCKSKDKLAASIQASEEKIPQLEATIKESVGQKAQLEGDLKSAKADRAEATATLAKAQSIREKEASDFAAEAAESKTNIAAMAKAIPAIEQGSGAAFLQTNAGVTDKLRQLSVSMDMEAVDRDLLASFLADGSTGRGSGEILGILKTMHEEMSKDLADMTEAETSKANDFESLVAAKKKEKNALTKSIETKTVRVGELAVKLAETANDLEDTQEALVEDKKMLAGLDVNCKIKQTEWDAYKKVTSAELVALADTVKMLNDDDALDLFKKTLPGAGSSFMQVQVTAKSMQRQALQMLKSSKKHRTQDPRLDFLEMALHGGHMGYNKLQKIVDDLMTVLKKEQVSDDDKKSYCTAEFDKYEDMAKGLTLDISDVGKAIGDAKETVKTAGKEIVDLTQGIKDLDASVKEATETRKAENSDYVKTLSSNGQAKDLLGMARNRLNKFYNPKSFAQVDSQRHHQTSKKQESSGVIALIDSLIADLAKDNQELEMDEKNAQKQYEQYMGDAKTKRGVDAKVITDKEASKAAAEAALEENLGAEKEKKTELVETNNFLMGLHQECDWLLKYHDTRKEARTDEIESLDKTRSVLSGADYSFLQTGSMRLRGSK